LALRGEGKGNRKRQRKEASTEGVCLWVADRKKKWEANSTGLSLGRRAKAEKGKDQKRHAEAREKDLSNSWAGRPSGEKAG